MMKSAKKEEHGENILEALQIRRKLLQEHYKNALVTNTTSYQSSCGDSSDEYDSEDDQQQYSLERQQYRQVDQHDDNKKRDLEYYHPEEQHDTRKWKKRKGLVVERNKLKTTAAKIIADESSLEDESSTIEVVEKSSDSIKPTKDSSKEGNKKIKNVQHLKKKTRKQKRVLEEILTPTEFKKLSFEEKLNKLAKYKEVHGHCNVSKHITKQTSLACWVYRLRATRRGGKNGYKDFKLTPANIAKLDELGFQWKFSKTFEERLHDLKEYKAKHGNCKVPSKYEDNQKLGKWVATTRAAYKAIQAGKKPHTRLTQSMINQLNDIDSSWQVGFTRKKVRSADEYILDLQTFKDEHGHCNVPRRYNKQLGLWVKNMRAAYRSIQAGKKTTNRLTPSMINQLNDMGFSWQVKR